MMRSQRVFLVLGTSVFIGLIGGLIGLGALLIESSPALSLESLALHAPPTGYQPAGACISGLGQPYRQTNPPPDSPAQILFYSPSGLTTVLYLLEEQPFRDGQSVTLLSELGGLPITYVSMLYSERSPFPKGNPINNQLEGPFYQLWIHIDLASSGARTSC
jgi:hypothetical protein